MTDDTIDKFFTVIFTEGDLPTNPMSLRVCAVCGGVFTRDQSWAHSKSRARHQPCSPLASSHDKSKHTECGIQIWQ
jgi:hypothetical protein